MKVKFGYKDRILFFIAKGTEIILYILIGMVLFYVLVLTAKNSFSLISYKYEITSNEWLTFTGSLVASMLGVFGGFMAARMQLKWNREIQTKRLKKYLQTILYHEVKLNNDEFYNYYWGKQHLEMDRVFRVTDWEKIKSELYILDSEDYNAKLVSNLSELYSWLERTNQLINMKININENSRDSLYRKIRECLLKTLNEFTHNSANAGSVDY